MRKKHVLGSLISAIVVFLFVGIVGYLSPDWQSPPSTTNLACASCDLVIEPDNGMAPLANLIANATSSIDLVMYDFEDPSLEADLVAAAKRNVAVRVLLNNGYQGDHAANQAAYNYFTANGVQAKWTPSYFTLTHEKSVVVDRAKALIMTYNLNAKYYATGRDFGVIDGDASDVSAMEQTFDDDWQADNEALAASDALIWSPDARDGLITLIENATGSLDIYNEEMADTKIINALDSAASRGVAVRVVMTYESDWKKAFANLTAHGVAVRTYKASAPLYIHAKMILADGSRAFLGSQNFSATSLDKNRELGVIISKPEIVATLSHTFESDWQGASPF